MAQKLVFMVTHGPEEPERSTIPFAFAVGAQTSGVEVVMGFQVEGMLLLKKRVADGIKADGFVALKDLLDIYTSNGGKLLACGPCVNARHIKLEEFIQGATVANAPTFIEQFLEADNVPMY